MKQVQIYTDGSCLGNPGPGGWAALLYCSPHQHEISGGELDSTNNRMELMAAIAGLELLKQRCYVQLHTDSQYVRQGITQWLYAWQQRNWKTASGKPVKNQDLWQRLYAVSQRHCVDWYWVKGHAGNLHNERVDQLARAAALSIANTLSQPSLI